MKPQSKEYSVELSDKIVEMMKLFLGKSLDNFPIHCLTKWLGGTLTQAERGIIAMDITVRPDMTNPSGFLHGGIQSAMLDDAMGTACATLGYINQFLSTNLSVDYLGTAKTGDDVSVKGYIFREGNSLMHAVGEITKDNVIIAKAQSNVFISNQPANYLEFMNNFGKK